MSQLKLENNELTKSCKKLKLKQHLLNKVSPRTNTTNMPLSASLKAHMFIEAILLWYFSGGDDEISLSIRRKTHKRKDKRHIEPNAVVSIQDPRTFRTLPEWTTPYFVNRLFSGKFTNVETSLRSLKYKLLKPQKKRCTNEIKSLRG